MNNFAQNVIDEIKSIKSNIKNALAISFQEPLIPDNLINFIKTNCVISGGISASIYNNTAINDIDLYFKSAKELKEFNDKFKLDKKFLSIVKDVNEKYSTATLINGKLVTTNAITLINNLQIITVMTLEDIDASFDFIHCKPYYDIDKDLYFISKTQFESIKLKKLIANNKSSITDARIEKFKKRGWSYPAG